MYNFCNMHTHSLTLTHMVFTICTCCHTKYSWVMLLFELSATLHNNTFVPYFPKPIFRCCCFFLSLPHSFWFFSSYLFLVCARVFFFSCVWWHISRSNTLADRECDECGWDNVGVEIENGPLIFCIVSECCKRMRFLFSYISSFYLYYPFLGWLGAVFLSYFAVAGFFRVARLSDSVTVNQIKLSTPTTWHYRPSIL